MKSSLFSQACIASSLFALFVVACSSSSSGGGAQPTDDAGSQTEDDAATEDASTPTDTGVDAAPICVDTFGDALTNTFGRLDGTLVGIVRPQDQECAQPNGTHFDLEVQMGGANYRMLVNVQSDDTSLPDTYYLSKQIALPGMPWTEGWHTDQPLDYATLGVHTADFTSHPIDELTNILFPQFTIGQKLTIWGLGFGSGAHDIHKRTGTGQDGAVVIGPDTANPTFLMFRFDDSPAF
ncbi:MAG TPA: hypothetical protein VF407_18060 [Polyangiaceae bacterium]